MIQDRNKKEPTKAELSKKVDSWKVLNSVLVQANAEFMSNLRNKLIEKQTQHDKIKEKFESNNATEDDNAEYLFLGGYIECLKDILNAKKS